MITAKLINTDKSQGFEVYRIYKNDKRIGLMSTIGTLETLGVLEDVQGDRNSWIALSETRRHLTGDTMQEVEMQIAMEW